MDLRTEEIIVNDLRLHFPEHQILLRSRPTEKELRLALSIHWTEPPITLMAIGSSVCSLTLEIAREVAWGVVCDPAESCLAWNVEQAPV